MMLLGTTAATAYRVRGTLLATQSADCYAHGLDVRDVGHVRIAVDLVVEASGPERAASDAAWSATAGYTTWRWEAVPVIEEVQE